MALTTAGGASSSTIGSEFGLPPPAHRRGSSVLTANDSQTGGSLRSQGNFLQRWLGRSARNLNVLTDKQGKLPQKSRSRSEPNLGPRHLTAVLLDEQLTTTTNSNESDQPSEIK